MDRRPAGICGAYCGACTIFRSFQDGGELLEELSNQPRASKEDIHCSGYRGPYDQLWMYCRACEIRKCMEKKGIETCFNCVEFQNLGCRSFEEISAFAQDRGRISGRILSNFTRMNLAGSSSRIQNGGVRAAVGQSHGTNADVVTALVNCGK